MYNAKGKPTWMCERIKNSWFSCENTENTQDRRKKENENNKSLKRKNIEKSGKTRGRCRKTGEEHDAKTQQMKC